nr:hypothetical protein [uncultured Oscillibacter sp.]
MTKAAPRIFVGNFPKEAEKGGRKVKVSRPGSLYNNHNAWRERQAKRKHEEEE